MVSVVLKTVAVNIAWPPSTTLVFAGLTLTVTAGVGGGAGEGGGEALPPPQPSVQAPSMKMPMRSAAFAREPLALIRERDRMPLQKQAKGQRREEGSD